jgi:MFS family permease
LRFIFRQTKKEISPKESLLSLALASLIPAMCLSIASVALPTISEYFETSLSMVNWIVVAYLIAITSFVVGAGALGDHLGRKKLLLTGLGIFSLACVICALATNIWLLVIARFIQGLGAALILSQTLALVGTVPKQNTGKVMGLMGTIAATGTALGPVMGGIILDILNWQFIFWLMLLIGCVSYFLCKNLIPDDAQQKTIHAEKYDFVGTILLSTSCFFYALSITSDKPLVSIESIILLFTSMACFYLFTASQRKLKHPLISFSFFRNKRRNAILAAIFVVNAVAMSTLVVGPFYLTYALQIEPIKIGLLMAMGPLMAVLTGYPSGKLVDLLGTRKVMLIGLAQMVIGALSFGFLPVITGTYGYIAALIILTPGRQMFLAATHTFIMQNAIKTEKGLVSGILNLSKNLGLLTGASLVGGVFLLRLHADSISQASPHQVSTAFTEIFIFTAIILSISLLCIYQVSKQGD